MSWTRLALPMALLASAPAAGQVSDFRLPADEPTPPPDVQGPVAPDVPASRRLGTTPTPTPSRRTTPAPSPTAEAPVEVPEGLQPAPAAGPARSRASDPSATSAPASSAATPLLEALEDGPAPEGPAAPLATPEPPPTLATEVERRDASQDTGPDWWLVGVTAAGLLVALGLIAWQLRRRARPGRREAPARVERPRVSPETPRPLPQPTLGVGPLHVSLEPLRLSLTLLNATLAYRLEVANRGPTAVTGLRIAADMISAHASLSREEQLSGPRPDPSTVQRIERLEPGESRVIAGEFRLPLVQVLPIRQGNAALLLPLARFRVEGDGAEPVVRTYVVGQPGQGSGLQPFRLDLGPRIYPQLAQRAFA
jgi:hypothetical protein